MILEQQDCSLDMKKSADHLLTRGFPRYKFSSCKCDMRQVEQCRLQNTQRQGAGGGGTLENGTPARQAPSPEPTVKTGLSVRSEQGFQ